jgi:arsenate reductase-like glutaredoxin family protein
LKKQSWRALNQVLSSLGEEEVLQKLQEERVTYKRVVVLERLHQRYNTLRVARERIELLQEAVNDT